MPDLKYSDPVAAARYSHAPDYVDVAKRAVLEMFRQTGPCRLDEDGMLRRGVLIRHLVLPGNLDNTFGVIDWVRETFREGDVLFSLMAQYTPMGDLGAYPEIDRPLSAREYDAAQGYLFSCGLEDGYIQDLEAAGPDFIPDFDLTGV